MQCSRHLIVAPTADVVTLAEAKSHLRVDSDDEDATIGFCIAGAVNQLDPAWGGWLARALRPQTWELRMSGFPAGLIELPYPPLTAVDSVKYDDGDGVERTLALGSGYRVIGFNAGDELPYSRCSIAPPYSGSWPSARSDYGSVRIRFTCGYPIAAAASGETPAVTDDLPGVIRSWLLLVIGVFYENRELIVVGATPSPLPPHIINMIWPQRDI